MPLPSFAQPSAVAQHTAPIAPQGPAPAPSYGDFDGFGTAKISDKSPPKPGLGLYECTCTKVIRKPTALIFEYVIDGVRSADASSSQPGFRSSVYRDTKDPKYFGYTAQVALAIAGVDTSDKEQTAAAQQYLPAVLAAATTGQTCFAPDSSPVGPDCLIGRRFLLQVSPGSGKTSPKTGLPYNQEDVFAIAYA
jgi:hypothetical protein